MPARHRSRHRAVQILYQMDMRQLSPQTAIAAYYGGLYSEEHVEKPEHDAFMEDLVRGAASSTPEADQAIARHSAHWTIGRMPVVERNILRLAFYEIQSGQTPPPIVIDEALELTRRFAGQEAVPFVNGVLDAVRKDLEKVQNA